MADPITDKTELNKEINDIFPPKIYPDYMKNLQFPLKIGLPDRIINDINFNEDLQYGGSNLLDTLSELYKNSLLKRSDMRKIINYYKNITKNNKKK